jgi:hypothetical protein
MYALGAGEKFDVNGTSEFIETIICKCLLRPQALLNWGESFLTQYKFNVGWELIKKTPAFL